MPSSVSIKDIARVAGVSASTVSRALTGHPRISEDTAERVRQLAEEMGYTPSLPARSLVTRDTMTVGLLISHASDLFLARLVMGVEDAAWKEGYSVYLSSTYRDAEREHRVIRSFYERRASGIVVTSSQIDAGYLHLRRRYPLPIVLVNCPEYPQSVSTDSLSGALQAMEHLWSLGHRRIAYIGNPLSHQTNLDRMAGYRKVLALRGRAVDEELVVAGDGQLAGGMEAMGRLLALPHRPTAVFCFNDMTAMGALRALAQAGLEVPHDCSVVGFDDLQLAAYYCPPLTTVRQPSYQLGQRAMCMLLSLMAGEDDVPGEVLTSELVVRETTGPAPAWAGREERR